MDKNLQLEKPGAGLPFFEAILAKYILMPTQTKKAKWDTSIQRFLREGEKILKLTENLNNEQMKRRVLISRIRGMEDSSRYWSVAMTIEHLLIVGVAMRTIISTLASGHPAPFKVDTALVKPNEINDVSGLTQKFKDFLSETSVVLSKLHGDPKDSNATAHPWFGPMNAHQWNWLIGTHQAIHRKQIEKIIEAFDQ